MMVAALTRATSSLCCGGGARCSHAPNRIAHIVGYQERTVFVERHADGPGVRQRGKFYACCFYTDYGNGPREARPVWWTGALVGAII
jgi:hypothetical protein